jgi:hypothetical protein
MPRRPRFRGPSDLYNEQWRFLDAIRSEAPQVLGELFRNVLPYARAARREGGQISRLSRRWCDEAPLFARLSEALASWRATFHLDEPWIDAAVFQTLDWWADRLDLPKRRVAKASALKRHPRKRAVVPDEAALSWVRPATRYVLEGGGPRVVRRNHFRWLVRWQVLGETCEEISRTENARARTPLPPREPDETWAAYEERLVIECFEKPRVEASKDPLARATEIRREVDARRILERGDSVRRSGKRFGPSAELNWRRLSAQSVDKAVRRLAKRLHLRRRAVSKGRKRKNAGEMRGT